MDAKDQQQSLNTADEISLKDLFLKIRELWQFLLSKWLIILIAGIIGGAIGFTYARLKKPIYKGELSFALQDPKSGGGLGAYSGIASQLGLAVGSSGGGAFSGDNLLQLMKSRSMVEKALLTTVSINGKKETLAEYYISFNKLREGWKGNPELENMHFLPDADRSKFTLKQDSILGVFHKTLVASNLVVDKIDKELSIISVKVNSPNELFSKYFTEVLAKVVSDFYVQTQTEKSTKNVAMLQRQTDSVRRVLNAAINGVALSVDADPNPNPALQTLHVQSRRREIDVAANTAILGELVRNLEVSKMSLLQETPLIQVIDTPILPLEIEKAGKLKGLIFGGMISGFLTIIILLFRKGVKNILSVK